MPSRQQRTRDLIFRCRDFSRDTRTQVQLRLVQPSPTNPAVLRRCTLTLGEHTVWRQHSSQPHADRISIQEASSMADSWTQEPI